MSQKARLLELLKANKTVSCRQLAQEYLYHRATARVWDLKREGYDIRYIPSDTDSPLDAKYELIETVKYVMVNDQMEIAI